MAIRPCFHHRQGNRLQCIRTRHRFVWAVSAVIIAVPVGAAAAAHAHADAALDDRPAGTTELAHWIETRDERMAWWREARLGMFIHWGLYSPAGGIWDGKVYPQHYAEWIQNWAAVAPDEYARQMRPRFDPDPDFAAAWAELAHDAGMRYAVLTAKHHDGFTLFNSAEPYSVHNDVAGGTNISPVLDGAARDSSRDLAREFADAMRARGLRAGFYYSLLDWQHPDAFEMALPAYPREPRERDHAVYRAYLRAHVNELLENYGPLSTIWFDYSDTARQGEAWGAADLLRDMRTKQPWILVNNRLYAGLENPHGDYGTPEKYVPPTGLPGMDWEVNHTLNESYGYSAHDTKWKSGPEVIRLLCDIVSKGGNLLLNIGPDARGRVPEPAERALRELGAWMRINGESIHGTTASPFTKLPWGRATQKSRADEAVTLYLMIFDWPDDARLLVPMQGAVRAARMLGSDAPIDFAPSARDGGRLELRLPPEAPEHPVPVIRLDLEAEVIPMAFLVFPDADGVIELLPHDAALVGPALRVEQVGTVGDVQYNIGYWTDATATAAWPIGISADHGGGTFAVEIEVACSDDAAGSTMQLQFQPGFQPGGTLEFVVPATGGWQQYTRIDLGEVRLPWGAHKAHLRVADMPGAAAANVRSIRMRTVPGM